MGAPAPAIAGPETSPIAVGRFSSRWDADWVAVADGRLVAGIQVHRFSTVVEGPTGQTAVVAVPRPGEPRDLFLGTGTQGLVRWELDPTTATPTATLLASGWSSVAGLVVDRHGVLYGWNPASSDVLRWDTAAGTSLPAITLESGIQVIAPLDWNDDGTDDLAYRTAGASKIVGRLGGSILWSQTGSGLHRIAVVRGGAGDDDTLVVTDYAAGQTVIGVFNAAYQSASELVLSGGPVHTMIAADVVGTTDGAPDGAEDLLIAGLDERVWVLQRSVHPDYRLFPDLWFPGRAYFTVPQGAGAVRLGAGDLDRDGDTDVVIGMPGLGEVAFQLDMRIRRAHFLPGGTIDASVDGTSLSVTLSSAATGLSTGATHLLVEAWPVESGLAQVGDERIVKGTIPLGSLTTHTFTFTGSALQQPGGHVVVATSYRAVKLDANGNVEESWPAGAAYVTNGPGSELEALPEVLAGIGEFSLDIAPPGTGVLQQPPRSTARSKVPPPLE